MKVVYGGLFLLLIVVWAFLFKKEGKRWIKTAALSLLTLASVLLLNTWLIFPSDTMTLTALNQKNEKAGGNSIVFQDVKQNLRKLSYHVVSGIWLDTEGQQKWGAYAPDNLTPDLTLRIPKGKGREITFLSNKWTGIVEIRLNDGKDPKRVDTYSDVDGDFITAALPDTGNLGDVGFANILLLLLEAMGVGGLLFLLKSQFKRWVTCIRQHPYEFAYATVAVIGFIIMMMYGSIRSIWVDDTSTMGIANRSRSLLEVLQTVMKEEPTSPPLYPLLWHLWAKIIPVGARHLTLWAKFPSIVLNSIGLYAMAIVVRRGWNQCIALISEVFLASSYILIVNSAYTVRPYGLLPLTTVLLLFSMVLREEDGFCSTLKNSMIHLLAILAICYTHFFGILLCFGFFIYEVWKFAAKRISWKFILPYIVAGVLYIPWLLVAFKGANDMFGGTFWPEIPDLKGILVLFTWLSSNQLLFAAFCIVGIFLTIYYYIVGSDAASNKELSLNFSLVAAMAGVIFVAYIYSKYLKPQASVWVNRYFIELIPLMAILTAFGVYQTITLMLQSKAVPPILVSTIIAIVAYINSNVMGMVENDVRTTNLPYREAADYLLGQMDADDDDTLILVSSYFSNGWDYYLTHNGKFNTMLYYSGLTGIDLSKYNRVYLLDLHVLLSDKDKESLEKEFHLVGQDPISTVYKYVR